MLEIKTSSPEETQKVGFRLGQKLKGNEVIAFFGGMGMGKTAFTWGIAEALGVTDGVSSPTFALVNEYCGKFKIFHFDMYRVNNIDDLYSTGFFDYFGNGVMVIEWSENVPFAIEDSFIKVRISQGTNENDRVINIEGIDEI